MYVSSFCSQLFGEHSGLEACRAEVKQKCDIDVLTWFRRGPGESVEIMRAVQDCVTKIFHKESSFIETLNAQERKREGGYNNNNKDLSKKETKYGKSNSNIFLMVLAAILVAAVILAGVKYSKWVEQKKKEKELNLKIEGMCYVS